MKGMSFSIRTVSWIVVDDLRPEADLLQRRLQLKDVLRRFQESGVKLCSREIVRRGQTQLSFHLLCSFSGPNVK